MKNRTGESAIVVSGGQTGVDRAALDAAMDLAIPVGGWCPRARRAEDGRIPERYPLRETISEDYAERTEMNIRDSDATLILCRGVLHGGTLLTWRCSATLGKQVRIIDLERAEGVARVSAWLIANDIARLNIAGPREKQTPGIYNQSYGFLYPLFREWIENRRVA